MKNNMNANEPTIFDFSEALLRAKAGKKISRVQFRDTCHVEAQIPDENSKMTKPYLFMHKKNGEGYDQFPVDLSCESLFAEDWYEVV